MSIPWEPGAKCPAGYERQEVRGARAVRRLEKELDAKDLTKHRHFKEQQERLFSPQMNHHRENLRHIVRNATHPFQKSLAQAALDRSQRGYSNQNWEAGNHRD